MNNNSGRMSYGVALDNSQLRSGAAESKRILSDIGNTAVNEGNRIDDAFKKIGQAAAGMFAAAQIKDFISQVATVRGEFQQLEIAFKTMLGSKEKADALMAQLIKTAATTPFQISDIAASAKQLLAYGLEADKVNETLIRLGDIAAGLSVPINDLAYLYGTTMVQGRLYTQDLNQFLGRGIPLMGELAKQFGVAESEVKKLVEEGKVGFPEVQKAIENLTNEGSKFGGLMAAQSQTITGQISNLEDQIEQIFNTIGQANEGVISDAIGLASQVAKHWEEIGKVLLTVIATYGAYKGAVLAVAAAHKLMAVWGTVQAFLSLIPAVKSAKDAMILFNLACKANPIGLVLSAVAAAATAYHLFSKETSEAQKSLTKANSTIKEQEKRLEELANREDYMADVNKKVSESIAEKINRIELLQHAIKDETASIIDREKAINELQTIVPKYNASLDSEGRLYNENTSSLDDYIKKLKELAVAKALQEKREELTRNKLSAELNRRQASKDVDDKTNALEEAKKKVEKAQEAYDKAMQNVEEATGGKWMAGFSGTQVARGAASVDYSKPLNEARLAAQAAKAELKVAQNNVKILDTEISNTTKDLKNLEDFAKENNLNLTHTEGGGGKTLSDKEKTDAQRLADQKAQRLEKIDEYSREVIEANKKAEFEIRQAEISAMNDGFDKTSKQIELNYDRLIYENEKRAADMIDELKEKKTLEWMNQNPKATKEQQVAFRASLKLTEEDLLPEQQKILKEYAEVARKTQVQGNRLALEEMMQDVLTYEQKRQKVAEEFAEKRKALFKKDKDGNSTSEFVEGVSGGNLEELNYQEQESLNAIDEQFAQREEVYQAWCNKIAAMSLEELKKVLEEAEKELKAAEKGGTSDKNLAVARAKVETAKNAVKKEQAKTNLSPDKRSLKEWQDLYKTLNECTRSFSEIGDAVGGTVGKVISAAGEIATSTLSMINGIVQLVQMSSTAMQASATTASKAIQTVEKASVILAVISAALQVATAIANLFNNDEDKQKEIERLQNRIDQLQWELDHADIIRLQENSGKAIERVRRTLAETYQELLRNKIAVKDYAGAWTMVFGKVRNNAELIEKTAQKLATAYANIAYTADKALGGQKYDNARQQLENISKQQILIQQQIREEDSKKKTDHGKIEEWERQIEELGQQAIEIINGMVEDIIGGSSIEIASELGDAFFEAFQAGEDYAEAWGDKVNEIVADIMKRMLISKFLEEPLGEVFNKYKQKWFKDGQFVGLDAVISSMSGFAADLNSVGADFAQIWENLPDSIKNMFEVTEQATREASEKGIATASQESVDELNGRATAIQGHTFSIAENTKLLLAAVNLILQSVLNIERHTEIMSEDIGDMKREVREVKDTVNDINLKGIKLK